MDELYRENILDHYKHPRNFGEIENPDASAERDNPLCGDEIKMDLRIAIDSDQNIRIKDIKFSGQGCAICMASASMLTEKSKGAKTDVLSKMSKDAIVKLIGTDLTSARIKCATLPLEVIHNAIINYGKKEKRIKS